MLHSRISRHLDREYQSRGGSHPFSLDRLQSLSMEPDSRVLAETTTGVLHGTID